MASYRSLFISDVHLGTPTAQAEQLLDFLREVDADTIYLVGDIVDFWRIKRGSSWPQSHNDVLQKLLRKVRKGARVVFIPGNHDNGLREYAGTRFGGIEIELQAIHETADGRRYLVMHGDEFDVVAHHARWLAIIGDVGYELALASNRPINWVRRRFGFGYWSLSAYLKYRVKSAVNVIGDFENMLSGEARRRGVDGIICGHIHHAQSTTFGDVHYVNCGDWVESCTAVVEHDDGQLEVVRWRDVVKARSNLAEGAGRQVGATA